MRVDVYFNLHKNKLSIRSRDKSNYGKVINHTDTILLSNCTFVVQEAGRNRVREENRKNVHAFVRGEILRVARLFRKDICREVKYNPYNFDSFVYSDSEEPVRNAEHVAIIGKKIIAYNPT